MFSTAESKTPDKLSKNQPSSDSQQLSPKKNDKQNIHAHGVEEPSPDSIRKAVEEEQKEKVQVVRRPQYPNFSIKHTVLDDLEKEAEKDDVDLSLPNDDFTKAQFQTYWNQYLKKLKENNTPAYNVMQTSQWLVTPEKHIELTFDSSVMVLEFEKIKDDFTKSVRQALNNFRIQVETKINTSTQVKSHIKTKKEIYEDMVKKNPLIEKLRISLGLDIENDF